MPHAPCAKSWPRLHRLDAAAGECASGKRLPGAESERRDAVRPREANVFIPAQNTLRPNPLAAIGCRSRGVTHHSPSGDLTGCSVDGIPASVPSLFAPFPLRDSTWPAEAASRMAGA